MKRPIDQKRDSGGMFTVGDDPDEIVVSAIVLGGRLLSITTRGVYAAQMADSIDPDRTDVNIPNVVTQRVLGYGSEAPIISRTLLTGRELFQRGYLGTDFDEKAALEIAFEAAQHLAAMADLRVSLERDSERAAEELQGRPLKAGFKLPVTPNLRSRGESFIRHADQTNQEIKSLCELFVPRSKPNENWSAHIVEVLRPSTSSNKQAEQFVQKVVAHIEAIRELRNASEHPDETKEITFWDFAMQAGPSIVSPSFAVRHPKTPIERTDLLHFMDSVIETCSGHFEGMAALLCNQSIKVPPILQAHVVQLDPAQSKARRGINYAYQAALISSAAPQSSDVAPSK
jgi:hypothetical protein